MACRHDSTASVTATAADNAHAVQSAMCPNDISRHLLQCVRLKHNISTSYRPPVFHIDISYGPRTLHAHNLTTTNNNYYLATLTQSKSATKLTNKTRHIIPQHQNRGRKENQSFNNPCRSGGGGAAVALSHPDKPYLL